MWVGTWCNAPNKLLFRLAFIYSTFFLLLLILLLQSFLSFIVVLASWVWMKELKKFYFYPGPYCLLLLLPSFFFFFFGSWIHDTILSSSQYLSFSPLLFLFLFLSILYRPFYFLCIVQKLKNIIHLVLAFLLFYRLCVVQKEN